MISARCRAPALTSCLLASARIPPRQRISPGPSSRRRTGAALRSLRFQTRYPSKLVATKLTRTTAASMASHWGLSGAAGVLIPAELDWSVKLGPQQLPGIYKLGGSYDTASLSNWYTASNGVPLPLTTAPPEQPAVAPSTCLGSKTFGGQILIPVEESQS